MSTDDVQDEGRAAPYRDPRLPVAERVADLLGRMTLEEKAGQLFHTMVEVGPEGTLAEEPSRMGAATARDLVTRRHLTHVNVLAAPRTAREFARWHNRLQDLAAGTRLGIPVTVSSDPRHSFTDNPGTALLSGPFSQWPETLGLAALRDERLVEEHADAVRREYLAVGIRTALHPQVDVLTEARWARGGATFGEDADLVGRLGAAYVRGLQGTGDVAREQGLDGTFGRDSVSTMTKHFPGGGPQRDGEDPHFPHGREQVYPGGHFETHLRPFHDLLAAGTRQVMPYYGMPVGLVRDGEPVEEVGFGFNRQVVTGLLREELGFDGIVCTDWGLVTDAEVFGQPFPARAWGVEHLTRSERVERLLAAGADQLGGEACPELVVDLVRSGRVGEDRVDVSVARLLREKFVLGLFDDARHADEDAAEAVVGAADLVAAGRRTQSRSVTVLTADAVPLPLRPGTSTPLRLFAAAVVTEDDAGPLLRPLPVPPEPRAGVEVVDDPGRADVALLRLEAPYERRGPGFESFFHAGSLEFPPPVLDAVRDLAARVPTVAVVHLDRPAVLTPLAEAGLTLVVDFGASTEALLDALTGAVPAQGRLAFDLPRSMAAVVDSPSDAPFSTQDPLFRFGHGVPVRV